jgi:hypothetical protein
MQWMEMLRQFRMITRKRLVPAVSFNASTRPRAWMTHCRWRAHRRREDSCSVVQNAIRRCLIENSQLLPGRQAARVIQEIPIEKSRVLLEGIVALGLKQSPGRAAGELVCGGVEHGKSMVQQFEHVAVRSRHPGV